MRIFRATITDATCGAAAAAGAALPRWPLLRGIPTCNGYRHPMWLLAPTGAGGRRP